MNDIFLSPSRTRFASEATFAAGGKYGLSIEPDSGPPFLGVATGSSLPSESSAGMAERTIEGVTEVSFDRESRTLRVVAGGRIVQVDGVDRLYVRSIPWTEADGTVRLSRGRVSVNGNIAAAVD